MTQTSTSTRRASAPASAHVSPTRAVGGVVVALVGSAVAVAVVAQVALALGASPAFEPLTPAAYLPAVAVGVLAGAVGWHVVRRFAPRPARLVRWLAPTVVTVSLVPDVLLLGSGMPGVGVAGVVALMAMHLVVAAVVLTALARTAPLPERRSTKG